MRQFFFIILCLFFSLIIAHAQKTTHFYLDSIAKAYELELCFSEDLVNLQKTIYITLDSLAVEDCIHKLSFESHLDIQLKGNNLIVTNPNEQTIRISGKLIDLHSGEPLPFSHIIQRDWGIGSITNSEGEFEVNIPSILSGFPLNFACMGYADTTLTIPEKDCKSLEITLRPKPYNLNEVLVLPNGNTAEDLVRMATKHIKRNYHRKTAQMEAFYRRTGFRDSTFTQLIEATLLIEDKGIDMPTTTTKIKLVEIRKSKDYLIPLSAKYKWAYKRMEKFIHGGHRNTFYRAYNNPVRAYKNEWWYKPLCDYETFKYELEGAMWLDSAKVYKVKFEYNQLFPDGTRASESKNFFSGGYIYIDAEDYGIHQLQYFDKAKERDDIPHQKEIRKLFNRNSIISFQKINHKYYLKYTKALVFPQAKMLIYENPDAEEKDRRIKSHQWAEQLLVITNIITDRKQRERIRLKEQLDKHENSFEQNYPYNPEFWENYSMIKQRPLPEKAIEDLQWEKSLELQFEENSTANVEN
ncbi:carboxypeptidase-like regulatory domain-containing protein [Carboxylicivirga sp. M1479]|uniref:carboxypeptidase-like regulatory domain-containing protein n=1 Tax=Carboxylicivirga sp. M1479 TaxID=2594476 RepID=UPI00117824AE|nr:carboxypeptidase-like regulatory domain-containing protein [Carboxylicivirga sp. M1479]TRX62010.1 carboxypeptidase-like regulatory domain-containing protein [Carboxylicivirga sp. M1479]